MTFFDFILGVSIGTITATVAIGPNRIFAALTLVSFVVLTIILSYSNIESFPLRKLINSEPVVVIENGKIIDQNLRKTKLTLNDLNMQLRQKNIFNISDVEFAVIETNGKISVLPKSQKQPLTPSDIGLSTSYKGLMKDMVIDGKIMDENLDDAHLDKNWLTNELNKHGIYDVKDVFYAGLDTAGGLYISAKKDYQETEGQHGIE
ncbi:DUF421 domain-containing protein [Phosphitispora sp. TUW77]|uniref:DUF421 domain-containing protein n=1 Tax=Phosphitispora sp. TUW77 TaxID=3152361 RepID=UPI003AB1C939